MHDKNANLSLAPYQEPSNWQFYFLVGLLIAALIVVFAYFYTGYAQDVLGAVVSDEEKVKKKSASSDLKRKIHAKLSALKEHAATNPQDALKEAMGIVDGFFSSYLHIAFVTKEKVLDKLARRGKNDGLQNLVSSLYDDYANMVYGNKGLSKASVSAFISKAGGIIHQC